MCQYLPDCMSDSEAFCAEWVNSVDISFVTLKSTSIICFRSLLNGNFNIINSTQLTLLVCWLQLPESHHGQLFTMHLMAILSSPRPVWNSVRGVLCRCSSNMEPASNRTQVDAFHTSFQAPVENILVPTFLLQLSCRDRSKLDNEMYKLYHRF